MIGVDGRGQSAKVYVWSRCAVIDPKALDCFWTSTSLLRMRSLRHSSRRQPLDFPKRHSALKRGVRDSSRLSHRSGITSARQVMSHLFYFRRQSYPVDHPCGWNHPPRWVSVHLKENDSLRPRAFCRYRHSRYTLQGPLIWNRATPFTTEIYHERAQPDIN